MDAVAQQLLERCAILKLSGSSQKAIAAELNISERQVKLMLNSDEFPEVVKNLGESLSAEAKNKLRKGLAGLVDKSLKVLEANLEEGELEAVKIVFRGLGFDQQDQKQVDTQIQVILPNTHVTEQVIHTEKVND